MNRSEDKRLFHLFDILQLGQHIGAFNLDGLTLDRLHIVDNGRRGRNKIDPELPFKALLNDLHVQQPQEAATETKP